MIEHIAPGVLHDTDTGRVFCWGHLAYQGHRPPDRDCASCRYVYERVKGASNAKD